MEPFTPNPLDYSLLGWLYATASKDEQFQIKRGLVACGEALSFFESYSRVGYDFEEAPNAEQYRRWGYSEADILRCHSLVNVWVMSRTHQHNLNFKLNAA